jgi:hypothetical protein
MGAKRDAKGLFRLVKGGERGGKRRNRLGKVANWDTKGLSRLVFSLSLARKVEDET